MEHSDPAAVGMGNPNNLLIGKSVIKPGQG